MRAITVSELDAMKETALLGPDDLEALRRAGEILAPRVEEILDVWYGFVGSKDFLLASFSGPEGPIGDYLAAVRVRFGQWILDTTRAEYDAAWLAQQLEIGRRHYTGKNETDGAVDAPELVPFRYLIPLVYPIFATVRPFLEQGSSDGAEVDRMQHAWLKSLLVQISLWSQPYVREGAF